jgi:hypothetical protein
MNDGGAELIDEAAEKGPAAFMRAQALAGYSPDATSGGRTASPPSAVKVGALRECRR